LISTLLFICFDYYNSIVHSTAYTLQHIKKVEQTKQYLTLKWASLVSLTIKAKKGEKTTKRTKHKAKKLTKTNRRNLLLPLWVFLVTKPDR